MQPFDFHARAKQARRHIFLFVVASLSVLARIGALPIFGWTFAPGIALNVAAQKAPETDGVTGTGLSPFVAEARTRTDGCSATPFDQEASQMRHARRHWIGVERGWKEAGADPLDHLVALTPEELKTHLIVLGSTGSGKTNLIDHLIAQDIRNGTSFIILDLRGDLADAVLDLGAGYLDPRTTFLLDLREKKRPSGFNPLKGGGEPHYLALSVLDAVAAESESWGIQLAETLRYGLLLLTEAREPLPCLESLFTDEAYLRALLDRVPPSPVTAFWGRYLELSREKRESLAMPVMNKVSLLFATKTLRKVLGHPRPLNLKRHLNTRGSAMIIALAVDELHGAGRMMGRIVLSSIAREIFSRVGVAESNRNPVRLYVDEFEHFGTSIFEDFLAEGRRFKFSTILSHQTLSQLAPKLRSAVLGNVGAKVFFRSGQQDAQMLSRDLTGDPRALRLPDLRVGEAVLWTRDSGIIPIEVNAPIVRGLGERTPRARAFVRQLQAYWGASADEFSNAPGNVAAPSEDPSREDSPPKGPRTNLEDWLL